MTVSTASTRLLHARLEHDFFAPSLDAWRPNPYVIDLVQIRRVLLELGMFHANACRKSYLRKAHGSCNQRNTWLDDNENREV